MKRFILCAATIFYAVCGYSETVSGDAILAFVRTKLPNAPFKLVGSLKVQSPNGYTKTNLPVEMDLDWGAAVPTARYHIGLQTLDITWQNEQPTYTFSSDGIQPTDTILDTGITWADLSFSMLWWPNAELTGEQQKINRDCYIVDVPVPGSKNTMRLWVEKNMGMLLEAQTFNPKKQEIRRMKIRSIKKMDGMWIAKDLEIRDTATGNKTTLQTTDLIWKNGEPESFDEMAFDPAESINQFTVDLYQKLAVEPTGNLFFSPYSISTALAMTYGGARGETAEQMNQTLHFGGPGATPPAFAYLRKNLDSVQQKGHVQLNVSNKLWPQQGYAFLPDYLALTTEFYGSEIEPIDYQGNLGEARTKINQWVENQTNNKIKNIIPDGVLNNLTRLVLVNAIYFKGDWAHPFDVAATCPAPFKLADGKTVEVPTMTQTARFKLAETETFQVLELPYAGDDLSMLIVLPNEPGQLPIIDIEALTSLEFNTMKTRVQLPRFKLESTFQLGETLKAMEMPLAFSSQADFSGMDGRKELYIDAILHKAFVEVNEVGTEAAAATGVIVEAMSMPPLFVADHPFLFVIRENSTGVILFIGRVMDPS